jgi:O-antigen/teichoic acid export membrane protein
MNTARVYRNTAILTALRFLEPAVSLAVTMAISRHLGPAMFGSYAVLSTAIGVTVLIGQLGLTTLLVREVAKRPEHASSYLRVALTIAAVTSVLASFGFWAVKPLLRLPPDVNGLAVLASVGIFPAIAVSCFEAAFTGFERMELMLFRSLICGVVRAAMMIGAVFLWGKLLNLIIVDLVTQALAVTYCVTAYRKFRPPQQPALVGPEIMRLLRATIPFFGMTLVTTLAARMDVFMLTRYRTVGEVALYVAAYKLFDLSLVLPVAYIRASFPQLSSRAHKAPAEMVPYLSKLLKDMWFYVTGAVGALVGFGDMAILIIFGHKFDASLNVLEILALAVIPSCLGRIFSIGLIARDLQRFEFYIGLAMSLVNVSLLRCLVPVYGIRGAAISTLSYLAFGSILYWFCARAKLGFPAFEARVNGFVISGAVCGAIVLLTVPAGIPRLLLSATVLIPFFIAFARKAHKRFAKAVPVPAPTPG